MRFVPACVQYLQSNSSLDARVTPRAQAPRFQRLYAASGERIPPFGTPPTPQPPPDPHPTQPHPSENRLKPDSVCCSQHVSASPGAFAPIFSCPGNENSALLRRPRMRAPADAARGEDTRGGARVIALRRRASPRRLASKAPLHINSAQVLRCALLLDARCARRVCRDGGAVQERASKCPAARCAPYVGTGGGARGIVRTAAPLQAAARIGGAARGAAAGGGTHRRCRTRRRCRRRRASAVPRARTARACR